MNEINYPKKYQELQKLSEQLIVEIPLTMSGFGELHAEAISDGELDNKSKELIALAIAITQHSTASVAFHVHDALDAGAHRREIIETIGVAILMGGSPAMVYGCEALKALNQFEQARDEEEAT